MLAQILAVKRQEVQQLKQVPGLRDAVGSFSSRDLVAALTGDPAQAALIAEVKKASPSRGILANDLNPESLAHIYAGNGAKALSVVTDTQFFQGRPEYLLLLKEQVELPLLRKDFIIDEIQLYHSLKLQADAVLLIAAALEYPPMLRLVELSRELGLEPLVEVHNREELLKVLDTPTRVIGVNNRDLRTFKVSLTTSLELAPLFPGHIVRVSESGISTSDDVALLKSFGYSAVLVGEALVTAPDPARKTRELAQVRL